MTRASKAGSAPLLQYVRWWHGAARQRPACQRFCIGEKLSRYAPEARTLDRPHYRWRSHVAIQVCSIPWVGMVQKTQPAITTLDKRLSRNPAVTRAMSHNVTITVTVSVSLKRQQFSPVVLGNAATSYSGSQELPGVVSNAVILQPGTPPGLKSVEKKSRAQLYFRSASKIQWKMILTPIAPVWQGSVGRSVEPRQPPVGAMLGSNRSVTVTLFKQAQLPVPMKLAWRILGSV